MSGNDLKRGRIFSHLFSESLHLETVWKYLEKHYVTINFVKKKESF
jgi:hypothetical protein